jgi:hypothetical protein
MVCIYVLFVEVDGWVGFLGVSGLIWGFMSVLGVWCLRVVAVLRRLWSGSWIVVFGVGFRFFLRGRWRILRRRLGF